MEPQQNDVVKWHTTTDAISAWCELSVTSPAGRSTVLVAKTYMDKRDPKTQKRNSTHHMQRNVIHLKVGDQLKQSDSLGIVRLEIRRVKENMEVECINGNDEVEMEYIDQPPQPPFITFEYHLKLSPSSMDGTTADSEDRDSDDSEKGRRPDEGLKSILRSGKRRRSSKFAEIEPSPSKNRSKPSKCVQNSLDNDMEQQPEMEEIQRTNPPFSERLRPERNAPPPDNDIEAQLLDISKRAMKLRKNNDETEARIREEQLQLEIEEEKVRKLELKALSDQIERRRLALKQRRTVLKRQETSVSTVSGKAKVLRVPRKKVSRGDGFPRPLQMHPNFFAKKSFGTP